MSKFIALYLAPVSVLENWMATPEDVRKAEEAKMQAEWGAWMEKNREMLTGITAGLGKTKLVTPAGISDTKNDIMMYSMVEAESHEAAAALFENHPHLKIPEATIEIMPVNPLPGMEGL